MVNTQHGSGADVVSCTTQPFTFIGERHIYNNNFIFPHKIMLHGYMALKLNSNGVFTTTTTSATTTTAATNATTTTTSSSSTSSSSSSSSK
jgi:hypothetical protein